MIKRIKLSEIPPKRGVSEVTAKALAEFEALKVHLKKQPLGPYEAEMVVLDDLPKAKPVSLKNATLKLRNLVREHVKKEKLPYKVFTRSQTLYIAA
jgi:hypothetical protein